MQFCGLLSVVVATIIWVFWFHSTNTLTSLVSQFHTCNNPSVTTSQNVHSSIWLPSNNTEVNNLFSQYHFFVALSVRNFFKEIRNGKTHFFFVSKNNDLLSLGHQPYNIDFIVDMIPAYKQVDTKVNIHELQQATPLLHVQNMDKVLVVMTTCNQLPVSKLTLLYLKSSLPSNANLLVLDDGSVDNTVSFVKQNGYFFKSFPKPVGLTFLWNQAYEFALQNEYKYIIYMNNDVLVPKGALDALVKDLKNYSLVVPMTTAIGAGHNPMQALSRIFDIPIAAERYIMNPRNTQIIQNQLSSNSQIKLPDSVIFSHYKNKSRFNGFLFGVNLKLIEPAAFRCPTLLFDDQTLIVGQEDLLVESMAKFDLFPVISTSSFCYHFKSITVDVSRDLKENGTMMANGKDIRENLQKFHPTTSKQLLSDRSAGLFRTMTEDSIVFVPPLHTNEITQNHVDVLKSTRCTKHCKVIVIATSNPLTNPAAGDIFTGLELATSLLSEHGHEVSEIRFVRKGKQWYDYKSLLGAHVLISLLDDYDITKTFNLIDNAEWDVPHEVHGLIYVAWMRNWFHRWINRPFIGHFDLLLVSSTLAKHFFEQYNERFGFQMNCNQHCPSMLEFNETFSPFNQIKSYYRSNVAIQTLRLATNTNRFSGLQAKERQYTFDYGFTGSYHQSNRSFMEFDPTQIQNFTGAIFGSHWNQSGISDNLKRIFFGSVLYEKLPIVYQSLKIIIDDANIATYAWGSVNSRVFDALASGALVISNGHIGTKEICGNMIPTFKNVGELNHLLIYYLEHEDKRNHLVKQLQSCIVQHHTYKDRAKELWGFITSLDAFQQSDSFSVPFISTPAITKTTAAMENTNTTTLCIGIRTYPKQLLHLDVLLRNFLSQHSVSKFKRLIKLKLFIVDTESTPFSNNNNKFEKLISDLFNETWPMNQHVHVMTDKLALLTNSVNSTNGFYGYDTTDLLLDVLQSQSKNASCQWMLLTNGDNLYNSAWFDTIAPYLLAKSHNGIAWDFVTHHPRNGIQQQQIRVSLKRGFIDLGSIIFPMSFFQSQTARFLPNSLFTKELFARDFFLIQQLVSKYGNTSIKLLHQNLMFHQ